MGQESHALMMEYESAWLCFRWVLDQVRANGLRELAQYFARDPSAFAAARKLEELDYRQLFTLNAEATHGLPSATVWQLYYQNLFRRTESEYIPVAIYNGIFDLTGPK